MWVERVQLAIVSRKALIGRLGGGLAILLFIICWWLLSKNQSGASVTTPWQTIHHAYIYVFFFVTLLLGLMLFFTHLKSSSLLIFLILYTLLLHSYLPLSHQLFYGADGWRHIANEAQILAGHWPTKPILADGTHSGFSLGDISYGVFWLVSAGISKIFGLGLITVTKWLQPVLWAVAFPSLLWKLTEYLGFSTRGRLFSIWLSNLPFALHAAGSFSLPVNFGLLFFLGGMTLLAARARKVPWATNMVLGLYALVMVVNYLLYLLLYLLAWGLLVAVHHAVENPSRRRLVGIMGFFAVVFAIPIVELLFGYIAFGHVSLLAQAKQFVGNFLGLYVAFGPRPHDIATGNILFNQPPLSAFVENIFTRFRWWIPLFAMGFWGSVGYFIYTQVRCFFLQEEPTRFDVISSAVTLRSGTKSRNLCNNGEIPPLRSPDASRDRSGRNDSRGQWLAIFTGGLLVSYFVGRYLLVGEQVLSRRLDATLALLAVICLVFLFEKFSQLKMYWWVSLLVVCSIGITASYSLGPDTQTVSMDEYRAMQYVWNQEKGATNYCVIADTYPLLALEALSGKKIVGGGFPINQNFAQPELGWLYSELKSYPQPDYFQIGFNLTKSPICWFVATTDNYLDWMFFRQGITIQGGQVKFGKIAVWRYTK